jgi:hypothetical protein
MPFVHVLGQGGAAIPDSVADDDADTVGGRDKRPLERVDVVAVGLDDVTSERPETFGGIGDREAASPRMVVVVEHGEIVELEVGGDQIASHTVPSLISVADQRIDLTWRAGDLGGQRHAHRQTDSVAKRTG